MGRRDLGRMLTVNTTVTKAVTWRMSQLADDWLEVRVCLRKQKTAIRQTVVNAVGIAYCVVKGLGLFRGYYRVPNATLIERLIELENMALVERGLPTFRYVHKTGEDVDPSQPVTALRDLKMYRRFHYGCKTGPDDLDGDIAMVAQFRFGPALVDLTVKPVVQDKTWTPNFDLTML
jgi:hypothetical protein